MNFPDGLLYSPDHMWVRVQGDAATVGLGDFAQKQLKNVQYVDLPRIGQAVTAGKEMGFTVEAAKSMTDLISPVSGKVAAVNQSLTQDPKPLHQDPYGAGWLARIELAGPLPSGLMEAPAYRLLLGY